MGKRKKWREKEPGLCSCLFFNGESVAGPRLLVGLGKYPSSDSTWAAHILFTSGPLAPCWVAGISFAGPSEVGYELSPLQYFQLASTVEKHPPGLARQLSRYEHLLPSLTISLHICKDVSRNEVVTGAEGLPCLYSPGHEDKVEIQGLIRVFRVS